LIHFLVQKEGTGFQPPNRVDEDAYGLIKNFGGRFPRELRQTGCQVTPSCKNASRIDSFTCSIHFLLAIPNLP
jgi:hypothetical protein